MQSLTIKNNGSLVIRKPTEFPKYFTPVQIGEILKVAEIRVNQAQNPKRRREAGKDLLLIKLLWQTGARITEIVGNGVARGLRVSDVDFDTTKTITFQTLKKKNHNSKPGPAGKDRSPYPERRIPLQDNLRADIAIYVSSYGLKPADRLIPVSRRRALTIVKNICVEAGMNEGISHPHTFRHSFAVYCILNHVPLPTLQKWLGHASILNTQIYVEMVAGDVRVFYDNINFEVNNEQELVPIPVV